MSTEPKCIVKCKKGHPLQLNKLYQNNKSSKSAFTCRNCSESHSNQSSFHCKKCRYDLCKNCYSTQCIKSHALKPQTIDGNGLSCDVCKNTFGSNIGMIKLHKCENENCDFNLCEKCGKGNKLLSKHENANSKQGFAAFGALGELLQIIDNHMLFMNKQETNVDEFIDNSGSVDLLRAAKDKSLETERELMQQIMNLAEINSFLNNIILIENLFNSFYTSDIKQKQEKARHKYASNINIYENKPKPECDIGSFVELMFAGTNLHISSFKKWLAKLVDKCAENNVNIVENSGAKGKNIERAFYKSFYVYALSHGNDGYKQMTDVLRCSIVFNTFKDLYHCFSLIEELSKDNGGILRCKDKFNPIKMPFGYRDLLINMYCPGSKVVAEIQLHHKLFFKQKKISHTIYKKARLFEEENGNMAYKYADQHCRKTIGHKLYENEMEKNDIKEQYEEEESSSDDEEDIFAQHECEMSAEELFEKWKLTKYIESFIDEEGYDDPNLWKDITLDELKNDYGFKAGHAKKFISYVQEMEKKRAEFDEIKKKRAKIKKMQKKKIKQEKEEVFVEVEKPQKGKSVGNLNKQQTGNTGLAKPQKLKAEGDIIAVETDTSPQQYITPPQTQTQTQVSQRQLPQQQYVAPVQPVPQNQVYTSPQIQQYITPPQIQQQVTQNQLIQTQQTSYNSVSSPRSQPIPQQQYITPPQMHQQITQNQLQQIPSQGQAYTSPQMQQQVSQNTIQQQYIAPPQVQQQVSQNQIPQVQQYAPPQQPYMAPPQQSNNNVLPPGWIMAMTDDGKTYYVNEIAKTTQWERPVPIQQSVPIQQPVPVQQPVPQQVYRPPQHQMQSSGQGYTAQTNQSQQQYITPPQVQQQVSQNQVYNSVGTPKSQPPTQQQFVTPQIQQQNQGYSPKKQQQQQQQYVPTTKIQQQMSQNQIQQQVSQNQIQQPQHQMQNSNQGYNAPQMQQIQQQNHGYTSSQQQQQQYIAPTQIQQPQENQGYTAPNNQQQPQQQNQGYNGIQQQPQNQGYNPIQKRLSGYVAPNTQQNQETEMKQQQNQGYSSPVPVQQPVPQQVYNNNGSPPSSSPQQQQQNQGYNSPNNQQIQQQNQGYNAPNTQHSQDKLLQIDEPQIQQQVSQEQAYINTSPKNENSQQQNQYGMGGMNNGMGGGMNINGLGGMGGMGGVMNRVNAMQNNMTAKYGMEQENNIFENEIEMESDPNLETFHNELATEIAIEDDNNFTSAFNSLYGQGQAQGQAQQQQQQQQNTNGNIGMGGLNGMGGSGGMGGFGNM